MMVSSIDFFFFATPNDGTIVSPMKASHPNSTKFKMLWV